MTALVDDRFGPVMSLPYRTMGLGSGTGEGGFGSGSGMTGVGTSGMVTCW